MNDMCDMLTNDTGINDIITGTNIPNGVNDDIAATNNGVALLFNVVTSVWTNLDNINQSKLAIILHLHLNIVSHQM